LIEQLKIERPAEPTPRRFAWWWAATPVLVVAAAAALYVFLPRAVPIQVAVAEPVAGAAVGPSSILDASGYVVARRQATVSAKITGKVVSVNIEEGQRVERDEIIARLDDTNAKAGVAQARAVLDRAGDYLGLGMAQLVNILNPQLIILAGEGVRGGEARLKPVRDAVHHHTLPSLASELKLAVEPSGDEAWARGAACLVLGELFKHPIHKGEAAGPAPTG
jgi:hypothetical protein